MGKSDSTAPYPSKRISSSSKRSGTDKSQAKESTASAEKAIDNVFQVFDKHRNGRITRENIRSLAAEHGLDLTSAELNDMVSFFDNSGTSTLSRADFKKLWLETSS